MNDEAILEGLLSLNLERKAARIAVQAEEDGAGAGEGEAED